MEKIIKKIEENTETIKAITLENYVLIAILEKMREEDAKD